MDFSKAFHLVAKASKKSAVPCVLIGGFAVNFYKVTRNTLDVDFLTTKEDFEKIKEALIEAGYAENFAADVAIRMTSKAGDADIDFMIVDEDTRSKILKNGQKINIVGEELIVPSVDHLIALKLHAIKHGSKGRMWKDLPDVIDLIKLHKVDIHSEEFRNACLKFGDEDIYKHILGFMK